MTASHESGNSASERQKDGGTFFNSLLDRIVRASSNEDSASVILESIGRAVGADRSYAFRFWDPGTSSMCTETHEWCADGIEPMISGRQTCDLADFGEFDACIASGRDFRFTDANSISAGFRKWFEPQGITAMMATPIVGANGKIVGFAGFDFVGRFCENSFDRVVAGIHAAANLLAVYHRLRERDMAVQDVAGGKNEYEENEREFERALVELQKDVSKAHPKHMLEIVQNRMDADLCYIVQIYPDGSGEVSPDNLLVRGGWTNTQRWTIDSTLGRVFDARLKSSSIVTFHDDEFDWIRANSVMESSIPSCLSRLKILHCFGVRNEGRLVGVLCIGYNDNRTLSKPLADFIRRAAFVLVTTIERISTYQDPAVALDNAHLKGEVVEFLFRHQNYAEVRDFVGRKVCEISGAQHLMLFSEDGSRGDWFGEDALPRCRNCAKAATAIEKKFPQDFFAESETVIVREGEPLPNMNLPRYCPMKSSVIVQFRRGEGLWRMVVDYTKSHNLDMQEVARELRTALEFLAIAYAREQDAKTIDLMQEHQKFRIDTLSHALSKDDLPGLVDLTLQRLLKLTACDYIAFHTVDGDHRLFFPGEEPKPCPERCESCSFYKLLIPPAANADRLVELTDARNQTVADIPSGCPAKSLEAAVVYCDGKPWGGIALHYVDRQRRISDEDRSTLKTAADVLTLALERHSSAVRLKAERDRVIEAEKARSYFFSSVSHDIRTPLNAIIGFSELLEAGGVSGDEAKQYLKMILSSGKTLLQLINDVLDLSKMDLGKMQFSLEPVNVGEIVDEMVPMFERMAKSKNQTIVAEVPDRRRFMVDPHRFRQLLFNFIGNAVKYAGPCTIRIRVEYADGVMTTTVEDDGKGVSAEKAKRLMQPFVQADIKNRTEGSGLGLAICKKLVDLARGTVSIETAPGKGFKIQTKVPVAVAADDDGGKGREKASAAAPKEAELPRRVLVVDDSSINRIALTAMLKKLGITDLELAEDGRAALDGLEKDPSFDLVLSDMWMPVMDGSELVRRIRGDGRLAHLKVCSITADVEARATYREQGFDALLLKPVTIAKLVEMLKSPDLHRRG